MMKQFYLTLLYSFLISGLLSGQGEWQNLDIPTFQPESVDNKVLEKQYNQDKKQNQPPQFAHPFEVSIDLNNFLEVEGKDHYTYYLNIFSPGAKSLNLGFQQFNIPSEASLYIYTYEGKEWLGPFSKEKREVNEYWTPVIGGDQICIKITVPKLKKEALNLRISTINHDFLGFGSISGSCNVDVACGSADGYSEIDLYRDIIRSVGVYTINGTWFCSGALINTADRSCKPYFLTANHCINRSASASGVVIYWNFENSYCRPPGSAESGRRGDGSLNEFNSGTSFLASNATSDFTLLEISGEIDESVNAFLAGWNREKKPPSQAIAIHHPSTDEKRISFEFDPLAISEYLTATVDNNQHYLWVDDWDIGTTESGSSGSPLFDENKRIVGQLSGGFASCGNEDSDWYGFMASNFSLGTNSSDGLKPHLDPYGTEIQYIDGEEYNTCGSNDIVIVPLTDSICTDRDTVKYRIINRSLVEDASLSVNPGTSSPTIIFSTGNILSSGDSTILLITDLNDYSTGVHTFELNINQGGNSASRTLNFSRIAPPRPPMVIRPINGSDILMPFTLEWENVGDEYIIRYSDNSDFSEAVEIVSSETQLTFSDLTPGRQYFFEITAHNLCGASSPVVASYKVRNLNCFQLDYSEITSIQDNSTTRINFNVNTESGLAYLELRDLNITHTCTQDLTIELETTGSSISLMDKQCGCSNNIFLGFKDDGLAVIPCPPTTELFYQPNTPFSAWYGRTDIDEFSFKIEDLASGDEGQVNQISLYYCTENISGKGFITGDFVDTMFQYQDSLNLELLVDTSIFGADNPTLLKIEDLPSGVISNGTLQFMDGILQLQLSTALANPGNYSINLIAESTTATDTIQFDLTILPCTAQPEILSTPDTICTYYHNFHWSHTGSPTYRLIVSDHVDPNQGTIYENQQVNDTNYQSIALPQDKMLYASVEALDSCVQGSIKIDSFYVAYNYDVSLSADTITICPNDTQYVNLTIGNKYFDDLKLDIFGDDANEFSFVFDPDALSESNQVSIGFTPGNSQPGQTYFFSLSVSDTVSFVNVKILHVILDWDEVKATPISPANNSLLVVPPIDFIWDGPPVNSAIEISKDENFNLPIGIFNVGSSNRLTFDDALENTTQYFWRIRSQSSCDNAISEVFRFTTDIIESNTESLSNQFSIFPNPVMDQLNYIYQGNVQASLTIYDIQGRQIGANIEIDHHSMGEIGIDHLSQGIYTLRIQIGTNVLNQKIIKLQ